jgi:NAD(P)-dependent dehydrogenase (short-subunit alcohol dehydrogenase family)
MGISSSKHTDVKSVWFDDFESKLPSLEGKTVAITGCTSGTGLVVAKTCARKGAQAVLLLNRPSPRAVAAEVEVKHQVPDGASTVVETIDCDLQVFSSVKNAASQIKSKYDALDVLCNNAGTFTDGGTTKRFANSPIIPNLPTSYAKASWQSRTLPRKMDMMCKCKPIIFHIFC